MMSSIVDAFGGSEACGARWTLGALLLAPLAATTAGYCTVLAIILMAVLILLAANTCGDLKQLATVLPPQKTCKGRRERNLRSFADFMAMWMTFLAHLVAVAICARVLSATADHVTGGRTRRWLFGYETRSLGEPWPDVLGVTVVMVVCAMFMCGLEESMMFTILLMALLYVFSQFFTIFGLINLDMANIKMPEQISFFEILSAGAPIAYSFSFTIPRSAGSQTKNLLIMIFLPMVVLCGLCFLYTNMLNGSSVEAALPVTSLLEARTAGWVCPVLSGVTVAGVCLALTELCPILFTVLVGLASPEWKVLTRSMTYESATTGSPVLAVFTAGSLAAILAFACPLSHMITLMNASHLFGIAIQAFHFTIMRCVPTTEQKEAGAIAYKRLDLEGSSGQVTKVTGGKQKRAMRFLSSLRHTKTLESIKSKVTKDTEERECLLLDEYGGCPTEETEIVGASKLGNGDDLADIEDTIIVSECEQSDQEITSGDDSTDIDAVVKEYQDRVQVVTATPVARAPVPPCMRGARLATAGAFIQLAADAILAQAFCIESIKTILLSIGIPLWLCGTFICAWQPAHGIGSRASQRFQGPLTMLLAALFLTPLLIDSWPAIILFAGAGVVIYARCERWCGDLAVHHARGVLRRHPVSVLQRHPVSGPRASTHFAHCESLYIAR